MYAGEILELVQTLLERTLDRCRAGYTEVHISLQTFMIPSGTVVTRPWTVDCTVCGLQPCCISIEEHTDKPFGAEIPKSFL